MARRGKASGLAALVLVMFGPLLASLPFIDDPVEAITDMGLFAVRVVGLTILIAAALYYTGHAK